ncbi:MAG: glutamate mutase L, partial [Clostridia bacterium]|nr:glutamate mutase L [Clostridia bacterium]
MRCDVLVAEIGSTTTLVNAFGGLDGAPRLLGQGQAPTSVAEGDVRIGLRGALEDLKRALGADELRSRRMLATSSAAGGLKMCVHGLVYDMTARAAEAAALGAGAVIRQTTAGRLTEADMAAQRAIAPNLVLLAGGTDYGERETALYNARMLAERGTGAPVIYAGNIQNRAAVESVFSSAGLRFYMAENVYPRLDELNI